MKMVVDGRFIQVEIIMKSLAKTIEILTEVLEKVHEKLAKDPTNRELFDMADQLATGIQDLEKLKGE